MGVRGSLRTHPVTRRMPSSREEGTKQAKAGLQARAPDSHGPPAGAQAWAAGSRGSLDTRALVLLTWVGSRSRAHRPPTPQDQAAALGRALSALLCTEPAGTPSPSVCSPASGLGVHGFAPEALPALGLCSAAAGPHAGCPGLPRRLCGAPQLLATSGQAALCTPGRRVWTLGHIRARTGAPCRTVPWRTLVIHWRVCNGQRA